MNKEINQNQSNFREEEHSLADVESWQIERDLMQKDIEYIFDLYQVLSKSGDESKEKIEQLAYEMTGRSMEEIYFRFFPLYKKLPEKKDYKLMGGEGFAVPDLEKLMGVNSKGEIIFSDQRDGLNERSYIAKAIPGEKRGEEYSRPYDFEVLGKTERGGYGDYKIFPDGTVVILQMTGITYVFKNGETKVLPKINEKFDHLMIETENTLLLTDKKSLFRITFIDNIWKKEIVIDFPQQEPTPFDYKMTANGEMLYRSYDAMLAKHSLHGFIRRKSKLGAPLNAKPEFVNFHLNGCKEAYFVPDGRILASTDHAIYVFEQNEWGDFESNDRHIEFDEKEFIKIIAYDEEKVHYTLKREGKLYFQTIKINGADGKISKGKEYYFWFTNPSDRYGCVISDTGRIYVEFPDGVRTFDGVDV